MEPRSHSVVLEEEKCKGCTNCIKRCPLEAIRVRSGKALILTERCIDCGECQRVCPVDLPLMELSSKIIKDINELYGEYQAGLDTEQDPPLLTYQPDDPAAFVE